MAKPGLCSYMDGTEAELYARIEAAYTKRSPMRHQYLKSASPMVPSDYNRALKTYVEHRGTRRSACSNLRLSVRRTRGTRRLLFPRACECSVRETTTTVNEGWSTDIRPELVSGRTVAATFDHKISYSIGAICLHTPGQLAPPCLQSVRCTSSYHYYDQQCPWSFHKP
jgi:hypothetical protein